MRRLPRYEAVVGAKERGSSCPQTTVMPIINSYMLALQGRDLMNV